MNSIRVSRRTLAIVAVLVPLVGLLGYVALRSGPLAPVAVTVVKVEDRALRPAIFGVGNVEARQVHRIGPTAPGRLLRLSAEVGDTVKVGQLLGEMDPVDNDDRLRSQEALVRRTAAMLRMRHLATLTLPPRRAGMSSCLPKRRPVKNCWRRVTARSATGHSLAQCSSARGPSAMHSPTFRHCDHNAPVFAWCHLINGVVTSREIEPGTTVVAGQAVIEVIDPKTLWINTRFDQVSAGGLAAAQPAQIALRSRRSPPLDGQVQRTELRADVVTEELLAKISFKALPEPLPPIGERAEVTVYLPELSKGPVIPNAAVQRQGKQVGVWVANGERVGFIPVKLGRADLSGHVQVLDGLKAGDAIVLFSEKALTERSRVNVVERLTGATP
jgi:HlyD family secretion protein